MPSAPQTTRIATPTKPVRAACLSLVNGVMTCSGYGTWNIRSQGNGLIDTTDAFWINLGSWKWAAGHAGVTMPPQTVVMAVTPSELSSAGIIIRANLHGEGLSHASLVGIGLNGAVTDDLSSAATIAVSRHNQVFVQGQSSDVPSNAAIGFLACTDPRMLNVLKTTGALINMGQRRMTKMPGR